MNSDIALLQPYWFFLVPLIWLWYYWRLRHPVLWPQILPLWTMRYPPLADLHGTKTNSITAKNKRSVPRDFTIALAFNFMLLALAQPVYYDSYIEQQGKSSAPDIIFAVDTALSMSLSDYQLEGQPVSRIGIAQIILTSFIKDYSGTRMGLVILGNPPSLWLPLTHDKAVVQDAVSRITTFLGGRITDMGATLNLIQEKFTVQEDKIVVLISDGGTQIGSVSPQDAAQELAAQGFTLYIIAVGSDDPDTGSLDNSSLIYEAANIKMLQEVAEHGNGRLFHALDAQGFSEALKFIQAKHRKPADKKNKLRLMQAWYPLPLAIALLLVLYAVFFQHSTPYTKREELK